MDRLETTRAVVDGSFVWKNPRPKEAAQGHELDRRRVQVGHLARQPLERRVTLVERCKGRRVR